MKAGLGLAPGAARFQACSMELLVLVWQLPGSCSFKDNGRSPKVKVNVQVHFQPQPGSVLPVLWPKQITYLCPQPVSPAAVRREVCFCLRD